MNDLELRSLNFALAVRDFCRRLSRDTVNSVYIKQVIRSSSIGANYIEANENLGKQDMLLRLRISRKEAKETAYWLELLITDDVEDLNKLKREVGELRKILSTIINKIQ